MRQQFFDPADRLRRQALEHVADVGVRIMPVEPRGVDQAHDRSGSLAGPQAAGEQPVISAQRDRPDLVLDPVVVNGQFAIIDLTRQRFPAFEAVVDRLGGGRPIGHQLPLLDQPLLQRIGHFP